MSLSPYGLLILTAIAVSVLFWARLARGDSRLRWVYVAALAGAFLGAKIVYLLAEGWLDWRRPEAWLRLATGKSILGGLLGGYAGVEIAKKYLGYRQPTGDWFAVIAPVGIVLGRLGCLLHGCCQGIVCDPSWFTLMDSAGIDRWPSVPAEIAFNLLALAGIVWLRRGFRRDVPSRLPGQHFHLYLIAYGAFRFLHEFVREEPRIVGPFSGYHFAALAVLGLGVAGYILRARKARPVRLA